MPVTLRGLRVKEPKTSQDFEVEGISVHGDSFPAYNITAEYLNQNTS